jgi:hypothetical protein
VFCLQGCPRFVSFNPTRLLHVYACTTPINFWSTSWNLTSSPMGSENGSHHRMISFSRYFKSNLFLVSVWKNSILTRYSFKDMRPLNNTLTLSIPRIPQNCWANKYQVCNIWDSELSCWMDARLYCKERLCTKVSKQKSCEFPRHNTYSNWVYLYLRVCFGLKKPSSGMEYNHYLLSDNLYSNQCLHSDYCRTVWSRLDQGHVIKWNRR